MKRVYYSSGSVLTGDRMADAIVRYAGALAAREDSDLIDIPISLGDGRVARAQLLIGPASQLVVVPEPGIANDPEDEATIEELARKVRGLSSPHPQASDERLDPFFVDGDDFGV
jgi:hypothetical protein